MVVDVVVVDVLGWLLVHEALGSQERATGGWRGGGGGQPGPSGEERSVQLLWVVGGAGAGAVAAQARGLAAGGLEDPGQVVIQDGLRVLLIAARGQEGEGVLGWRSLPGAGGQLGALLFILEGGSERGRSPRVAGGRGYQGAGPYKGMW